MTESILMDVDIHSSPLVAQPRRMPPMPENIWLDIFAYLSLEEKFKFSRTCRSWSRILADPSLYTYLILDSMEFNTLVTCMQQLCRLTPRIKSLRIANCYSSFISKATVQLQNTTSPMQHHIHNMGMHSLYTPITSCSLQRRREEYRKLGFTLHQEFSRALVELMEQSQDSVSCLEIQDNFLDLEMTELIFCIVRYGRHLEHLLYDGNKDGGFVEPQVVSAITAACPTMKSFHGQHGISDIVLRRMMTGWEELRSITLAPYQSSESSTLSTKEVSLDGLWSLLECRKVEVLELLDLHCISNEGACALLERVKQLESMSLYPADHPTSPIIPNHPFSHHSPQFLPNPGPPKLLPGASVRHLILTKYTSSPITLPGFAALLKLFPNLETLRFTTNYFAYDHQFQGLTKGIYEQEIHMVESIVKQEMSERWLPGRASACWYGEWHADLTEEQRLRVGHFIPNH